MMKKLIIILILMPVAAIAREITLEECLDKAHENFPKIKQLALRDSLLQLQISNIEADYLPEISLFGEASYQSDVTKIDIELPQPGQSIAGPTIPKDQYSLGINVNQVIWDGGMVPARKSLETAMNEVEKAAVEVDLYSLKEKVAAAYFGILLIDKSIENIKEIKKDLEKKRDEIKSAVENGMVIESNLQIIEAEIINLEKSIIELEIQRRSSIGSLELLCNEKFGDDPQFSLPVSDFEKESGSYRPEYALFDMQKQQLDEAKQVNSAVYTPKFFAYGQGLFARPGFDMFQSDFKPYYKIGVRASWSIWSRGNYARDDEKYEVTKLIVESNREAFSLNQDIALEQQKEKIEGMKEIIEKDMKAIELRSKIVEQSSTQLEAGYITSSVYVEEFNKKAIAIIELDKHKIELEQAKVNYMIQSGNIKFK